MNDDAGIVAWLTDVAERSARMVCGWMRHGFVHGVMNTDNMSIHGLTIDYGPSAGWKPTTHRGRRTPPICPDVATATQLSPTLSDGTWLACSKRWP